MSKVSTKPSDKKASKSDTHASAGVLLMTSMTYAPDVTSGKSECRSLRSFARLKAKQKAMTKNPEICLPMSMNDVSF